MSGMGDDCSHDSTADDHRAVHQRREDVIHTAMIRAGLAMARGLTPSQACQVGCRTCGVIDASPSRCEQCTGVHKQAAQPLRLNDAGFFVDSEGGEI